jgi:hypothetical protein
LDHSVHYVHHGWPIDLDLHYNFPGFLAAERTVFDALWERRTESAVAEVGVPTADRLGHVLVTGLHALRDPNAPRSRADLVFLGAVVSAMDRNEAQDLVDLAVATGSERTAAPILVASGLASPTRSATVDDSHLWEWRTRQQRRPGALIWLQELRETPRRELPGVVRRALFPDRDQLVSSLSLPDANRWTFVRLRVERLVRGAADALRHLRAGRRALGVRRRD